MSVLGRCSFKFYTKNIMLLEVKGRYIFLPNVVTFSSFTYYIDIVILLFVCVRDLLRERGEQKSERPRGVGTWKGKEERRGKEKRDESNIVMFDCNNYYNSLILSNFTEKSHYICHVSHFDSCFSYTDLFFSLCWLFNIIHLPFKYILFVIWVIMLRVKIWLVICQ